MNEAPCSWRVRTYSIDDLDTASVKRMFSSPGMPKTCVTPSFSRHSTISSAVVRVGSPIEPSVAAAAPCEFRILHFSTVLQSGPDDFEHDRRGGPPWRTDA